MTSTLPRPLLVLVALAAVLGGFVTSSPVASSAAIPYAEVQRIPGGSPAAIGVSVSQELFADGAAQAVILARSDAFPDSLAASGFAAAAGGPILFTNKSSLDAVTRDELQRVLTAGRIVYLLGGVNALSEQVENQVEALGYNASRFAGADRMQTAALLANALLFQSKGKVVMLARAFGSPDATQGWVDSVSCGGFAADRELPILLTDPSQATLNSRARAIIDGRGITTVHVCGGNAAVPDVQLQALRDAGVNVIRHAGADRARTAVAVAQRTWGISDSRGERFTLVPGFGDRFAYGVAASQLSARFDAPILLVDAQAPTACDASPSGPTLCYLAEGTGRGAGLFIVGGPNIISDEVASAAGAAIRLVKDTTAPAPAPEFTETLDVPEDDGTAVMLRWSESMDQSGVEYEIYYRDPATAWVVPADCVEGSPSEEPTDGETATAEPTPQPSRDPDYCEPRDPNAEPTAEPTPEPTDCTTPEPSESPTEEPSPSESPTTEPTEEPTTQPCPEPEPEPEMVADPLSPANGTRAPEGPFTDTVTTEDGQTVGEATLKLCEVVAEVDEEGNPTGARSAPCAGIGFEFIVVAVDAVGNTAVSQVVTVTPTDEVPPAPAVEPSAGAETSGQTRISWIPAAAADAAAYVLQRGDQIFTEDDITDDTKGCVSNAIIFFEEVEYAEIGRTTVPTTTFVDTTTTVGGEYCYRYAVIDTTGNVSGWSPALAFTR